MILQGAKLPKGNCPVLPELTSQEAYQQTCLEWPQNTKPGRDLGECCWSWIDG